MTRRLWRILEFSTVTAAFDAPLINFLTAFFCLPQRFNPIIFWIFFKSVLCFTAILLHLAHRYIWLCHGLGNFESLFSGGCTIQLFCCNWSTCFWSKPDLMHVFLPLEVSVPWRSAKYSVINSTIAKYTRTYSKSDYVQPATLFLAVMFLVSPITNDERVVLDFGNRWIISVSETDESSVSESQSLEL